MDTSTTAGTEDQRPEPREPLETRLRRLVEAGELDWGGGKPQGANPRIGLTPGLPLSQIVIDQRR